MEDPVLSQKAIYGEGKGPPMCYEEPTSKPPRRNPSNKRQKIGPPLNPTEQVVDAIKQRSRILSAMENEYDAGSLPSGFPPELAYRALAAYSLLRTLSLPLRLSPFTPNVFLRALYLPFPNKIMGKIHVALLRILFPNLQLGYIYKPKGKTMHKRRSVDNLRWPLRAGDNLTYMDGLSWPVFYDDYCHLTADRIYAQYNNTRLNLDFRNMGMQPIGIDDYQQDYAGSSSDDDDDDDADQQGTLTARFYPSGPPAYTMVSAPGFVAYLPQDASTAAPLGRGRRKRKQPSYQTVVENNSDSDSEYGGGSNDEDDAAAWVPKSRRAGRRRSPKKSKPKQDDAMDLVINKPTSPTVPPMPSPSRVLDVEMPIRTSLDPSTPTTKVNETKAIETSAPTLAPVEGNSGKGETNHKEALVVTNSTEVRAAPSDLNQKETSPPNPEKPRTKPRGRLKLPTSHTRPVIPPMASTANSLAYNNDVPSQQQMQWIQLQMQRQAMLAGTPASVLSNTQTHNPYTLAQQPQSLQKPMMPTHSPYTLAQQPQSLRKPMMPTHNPYTLAQQPQPLQKPMMPMVPMGLYSNMSVAAAQARNPMKPKARKPKNKSLKVEDDIAQALQAFVCGTQVTKTDGEDAGQGGGGAQSDDEGWEKKVKKQQWAHFEPLRKMRSGRPYHQLSVEHKLNILEFLIDELLSVDLISAEFTRRQRVCDCFAVPYGTWPTEKEFENIENADECGACQGEGELLCCDGCVASYHRECLKMSPTEELPSGKWLCPECKLVDPATWGSLHGGRKASLDWFSSGDIEMAARMALARQQENSDPNFLSPKLNFNMITNAEPGGLNALGGLQSSLGQGPNDVTMALMPSLGSSCDDQYLVIHGFVFRRQPKDTDEGSDMIEPFVPLQRDALMSATAQLDPKIFTAWPLAQIPRTGDTISEHFTSPRNYLATLDSISPSFYSNKYEKAPLSFLMKAGSNAQTSSLMRQDYESTCCENNTYRLSDVIIKDFSMDNFLVKSLRSEFKLYDPYHMIKTYLFKLENSLRRACLVTEFWEGGQDSTVGAIWLDNVRKARSIPRLSRLLLRFVDVVHPRAFSDGWFHNSLLKGSEIPVESDRHFEDLPADWTVEKECQKRLWQNTPDDMMLHLCEGQGCSLDGFVAGIREHVTQRLVVTRSKRKHKQRKATSFAHDRPPETMDSTFNESTTLVNGNHDAICQTTRKNDPLSLSTEKQTMAVESVPVETKSLHTEKASGNSDPNTTITETATDRTMGLDEGSEKKPATVDSFAPEIASPEKSNTSMNTHPEDASVILTQQNETLQPSNPQSETTHEEKQAEDRPSLQDANKKEEGTSAQDSNLVNNTQSSAQKLATENGSPAPEDAIGSERINVVGTPREEKLENADPSASGEKQKQKSRKRPSFEAPVGNSRRSTRRTIGRFSSTGQDSSAGPAPNDPSAPAKRKLHHLGASVSSQIENYKFKKVPRIEKLVKSGFQKSIDWPVCGRILFPTFGNLAPSEMRRLGRNGGVVKAPYVAYQTSHEVGQMSFAHLWRQKTEQCSSMEELILQLRVLESFLDRVTLHSCENVVRRGKGAIQRVVKISQRDPASGVAEHFVVGKGKTKGCWISSVHMDVSALILDKFTRRQHQLAKRNRYLQEKALVEKEERDKDRTIRIKNERAATQQAALLKAEQKAEAKRKVEIISRNNTRGETAQGIGFPSSTRQMSSSQPNKATWDIQMRAVLMQHQADFAALMKSSMINGVFNLPTFQLTKLRQTAFDRLKNALNSFSGVNPMSVSDEQLRMLISHSENDAMKSTASNKAQSTQSGVPTSGNIMSSMMQSSDSSVNHPPFAQQIQGQSSFSSGVIGGGQNQVRRTPQQTYGNTDANFDGMFNNPNGARGGNHSMHQSASAPAYNASYFNQGFNSNPPTNSGMGSGGANQMAMYGANSAHQGFSNYEAMQGPGSFEPRPLSNTTQSGMFNSMQPTTARPPSQQYSNQQFANMYAQMNNMKNHNQTQMGHSFPGVPQQQMQAPQPGNQNFFGQQGGGLMNPGRVNTQIQTLQQQLQQLQQLQNLQKQQQPMSQFQTSQQNFYR